MNTQKMKDYLKNAFKTKRERVKEVLRSKLTVEQKAYFLDFIEELEIIK